MKFAPNGVRAVADDHRPNMNMATPEEIAAWLRVQHTEQDDPAIAARSPGFFERLALFCVSGNPPEQTVGLVEQGAALDARWRELDAFSIRPRIQVNDPGLGTCRPIVVVEQKRTFR